MIVGFRRDRVLVPAILVALVACAARRAEAHPFHVSVAEAEFNGETDRLEVSLCVLPRDLDHVLERTEGRGLASADHGDAASADAAIADYLRERIGVTNASRHSGELVWVGKELTPRAAWLYFELTLPAPREGLELRNAVFFELNPRQVNTVNLRVDGSWQQLLCTAEEPCAALPFAKGSADATRDGEIAAASASEGRHADNRVSPWAGITRNGRTCRELARVALGKVAGAVGSIRCDRLARDLTLAAMTAVGTPLDRLAAGALCGVVRVSPVAGRSRSAGTGRTVGDEPGVQEETRRLVRRLASTYLDGPGSGEEVEPTAGDRVVATHIELGLLAMLEDDKETAQLEILRALLLLDRVRPAAPPAPLVGDGVEATARLAARVEDWEHAACLLGALEASRSRSTVNSSSEVAALREHVERALPPERFRRIHSLGRSLRREAILDYAHSYLMNLSPPDAVPGEAPR